MPDYRNTQLLNSREISIFLQPFGREPRKAVRRMICTTSTML